jgi:predicted glycoside hydrolase/deacetylase ChbG (UPF0249 family)
MMEINRRNFMQTVGAGAATLGLARTVPAAAAQAGNAANRGVTRRKMVIRADDIGMSKVCNIGTFDAIDAGLIGVAAVMLCDPGTEDALERLKEYPWISIDWHMHMWGSPVATHSLVPSLLERDKKGPFADRFRMDLASAQDVVFDEALTELRAQLDRCGKILGKVPDTGAGGNDRTPWGRAVHQVTEEYNIAYNFSASEPTPEIFIKHIKDAQDSGEAWAKYWPAIASPGSPADPKWASRKISSTGLFAFMNLLTDSISSVEKNYDPVLFYTEDRSGILKTSMDTIRWQAWHPGYVDYYTYRLGERANRARAQQFVVSRPQDSWAMRDIRLRNWIKENKIELINFRDALHGTSEFQNHLKAVGSDLCMV